jgi:outer membrane usher protein
LGRPSSSTFLTLLRAIRNAGIPILALAILPRPALGAEPSAAPSAAPASSATTAAPATFADPSAAISFFSNEDTKLLLDVYINSYSTGKVGEFTLRRKKLMARPDELRALGLQIPFSRASEANTMIFLSDLPGVTWEIDEKNQILYIRASNGALLPTRLLPSAQDRAGERRVIESGEGITLNDDIVSTYVSGKTGVTGSFDLRAFSRWGVASSGWLAYGGSARGGSGREPAIRLDTSYTFADVNSLRRYSLGDFITSGLSWTRSVHLEGAQIRSDFSMRPDLVTFPLPKLAGSAAVPSTVNVLTDGNLTVSHQVDAGPFEIPQLPVVSGAGTISMTVTNALGQQVTLSQPFYASSALLAPGLQTFAGQVGVVRRNWGTLSNDYGKTAATADYRRGLTRTFTIEGNAEGTPGAFMAGAGGVLQVGHLGVLNFAASPSIASGRVGAQFSLGAQRIGRVFSFGGAALVANANYRDVASVNGSGVPRKQLSAFSGWTVRRFGTIGMAYAELAQDSGPDSSVAYSAIATHSRTITANYSVQVHRASVFVAMYKNLSGTGSSTAAQVGLTFAFGRDRSASAAVSSNGARQLQVQQAAPQVGDWGYQTYASGGDSAHEFAQGLYKSTIGLFSAGVDSSGGLTTVRLETQNALSIVDKRLFLSNQISDSFGIVDTRPLEKIRVYQENRYAGTTGRSGRLLVPDMRSFELNNIGIESTDVPADVTLGTDKREVRPQDRSGVIIKFPVRFSHGALVRLVDETGKPLPEGSAATLAATRGIYPIGYDGQAYIEDLSPSNKLIVEYPSGKHCMVGFDYRPVSGDIPMIGPLRCLEKMP